MKYLCYARVVGGVVGLLLLRTTSVCIAMEDEERGRELEMVLVDAREGRGHRRSLSALPTRAPQSVREDPTLRGLQRSSSAHAGLSLVGDEPLPNMHTNANTGSPLLLAGGDVEDQLDLVRFRPGELAPQGRCASLLSVLKQRTLGMRRGLRKHQGKIMFLSGATVLTVGAWRLYLQMTGSIDSLENACGDMEGACNRCTAQLAQAEAVMVATTQLLGECTNYTRLLLDYFQNYCLGPFGPGGGLPPPPGPGGLG